MEDYSLLRHFPARVFFNAGVVFRAVPIFPTTFFLIQKIDNEPTLLRAIDDVLQCPSCGSKLSASLDTNEISCGECGFFGSEKDGIKDLTYVPKEARVAKEGD
jgi:ribosomal protein S27AE